MPRCITDTVLQDNIGRLLKRPVGRPPNEVRRTYVSLRYQAGIGTGSVASWPSSSGTLASFTLVSASSSPICPGMRNGLWPSTISAARRQPDRGHAAPRAGTSRGLRVQAPTQSVVDYYAAPVVDFYAAIDTHATNRAKEPLGV